MKIFNFLIVLSFVFFNVSFASARTHQSSKVVAQHIPYCSKKITRGCVKPKHGQSAKYYTTPKYNHKSAKYNLKPAHKKVAAHSKIKAKAKSKKVAANSGTQFHKNKQYKRNMASVLANRLKAHGKKKTN